MSDKQQRPSESKGGEIREAERVNKKFLLMFGTDQSAVDTVAAISDARAASIKKT